MPAVVLMLLVLLGLFAPSAGAQGGQHNLVPYDGYLVSSTRAYRNEAWRWQQLMRMRRTPSGRGELDPSHEYRRWVNRLWEERASAARKAAHTPPRYSEWMCIHRYEGGWRLIDGPYYGGLQMDLEFQRTYGPKLLARKGTAERWTPLEQIWVAERAYRSGLGYRPWPNTARMCGLL
jgi:hypothetical protein